MDIRYRTKWLERCCTDYNYAKKKYGVITAEDLKYCINVIRSFDSVETLVKLNIQRCHPLHQNRRGQYAMDLEHPLRLIFEKDDEGNVHIVKIVDITDYH